MTAYRFTPRAHDGFLRIVLYVHDRFGKEVAERVIDELESAFDLLATKPRIGHTREELTDDKNIRFWPVGPTLIAYRTQLKYIEILFVERGESDWEHLLSGEH